MEKIYQKSELLFSLLWIGVYVIGTSVADTLSQTLGLEKSVTFVFLFLLSVAALLWIKNIIGLRNTVCVQQMYLHVIFSIIFRWR